MKNILESVKKFANMVFHNRKIVIVSEGRVTTIGISRNFQVIAAVLVVAAVCWMPFSAGKIVALGDLSNKKGMIRDLSNVEQRVEVLQNDILLLEEYLRALHKYDNFEIDTTKNRYSSNRGSRSIGDDDLSELEEKRDDIMVDLKKRTATRISSIEGFLKSAGLDYTRVTGKKQYAFLSGGNGENAGGPFIPADSEDMEETPDLTAEFIDQMNYLFELQKIVNNLPFSNPIAYNKISSSYGVRRDPFNNKFAMHSGMDLAANSGAVIASTGPGRVTYAGRKGAYGLMVEIYHGYGYTTRYGHLKTAKVSVGDYVSRGQAIGTQGCSGRCTGDHLHYEVRVNDKSVNPLTYLLKASDIQYYYAKKL